MTHTCWDVDARPELSGSGVFCRNTGWTKMPKRTDQTQESLEEAVRPLAEEVLAITPYFLVDINVRGHWGSRVVEVYVDSDGEIGLDDLAEVSNELGFLLDVEDVIDGKYTLEVSSPGADRPLMMPQQYKKNVGRPLSVAYRTEGGTDKVEGELLSADDEAIEVAAPPEGPQRIPYSDIDEAKVVLPW